MPHHPAPSSIRQSFAWWAFSKNVKDPATLLRSAAAIGYQGVELLEESLWPLAQDVGLQIAAITGHGTIDSGLNDTANAARIEDELLATIAKASQWKIGRLICFSGRRNGASDAEGIANAAQVLQRVCPAAERAGVCLSLELLNSKVDHRDYQADSTAWGVRLCEAVGSPAFGLLYDIYHMQVMEGDVIRTIREHHRCFNHYHTAGNPGRHLPNEQQELNYPAIYRTIAQTGYSGFIGHEFLPRTDTEQELRTAYGQCRAALGD